MILRQLHLREHIEDAYPKSSLDAETSHAEVREMAEAYPFLPDEYLSFLLTVGCGTIGETEFQIYGSAQELAVRELLIAGEIFFVLTKSSTGHPQLIPVVSEQVRSTGKKGDKTTDGIFYDSQGKALSYQIFFSDKPTIVPAADVVHLKRFKNVNQKRGISAFACSLNSVRDVKDLIALEKKSIKVHSALAATVTKRSGEAGDGLFNRNRVPATTTEPTRQKLLERIFGGAIAYLGENEKVDLVQSNRSTDGFLKTIELLLRDVCLNLSLSYELVVDPTALGSAATRFVIQDAAFLFNNLQNTVETGCLHRLYAWVVASAIKEGKLPACEDTEWFAATFVRPQSATIDAGRKDAAELAFVQNNLQSLDTYYSSRGKTWTKELEQIAQEKQFLRELEEKYGVELTAKDLSSGRMTVLATHRGQLTTFLQKTLAMS